MSDPIAAVGGLVVIVSVVGLIWYFNPDNVTKRKLKAVPSRRLIEAGEAPVVRVTGTVVDQGVSLRSALSGRACVWYGAYVDEYKSRGKSGHWVEIIKEERCTEFLVDDGSAVARVRCVMPRVLSPRDVDSRSGTFDDATPGEVEFLAKHGHNATGFLGFNRRLRYREAAFEPGETVTVLGTVRALNERGASFEIVPPPGGEMIMSDDASAIA